jgi:hypothetical protein
VQNEIIASLVKSLEKVKRSCIAAKLATKHALLTTAVNSNG